MRSNQELATMIQQLSGMTYKEWQKIKLIVDGCFEIKQQEFKRSLELPTEEIENVIRRQFG